MRSKGGRGGCGFGGVGRAQGIAKLVRGARGECLLP